MDKAKNAILVIIALAIVAGAGYGLYAAARALISSVLGLDANIAAAILAASTTVIVSVLTVVYNQRKSKEREIGESHRPKKIELYKRFMDEAVVGLLRLVGKQSDKSIDDEDVQKKIGEFFFKFTGDVIVWGSPKVIKAYIAFRASADQKHIILKMDDMLLAIRHDLGNSNSGLERGELIGLFLTDPQELEKLMETETKAT